MGGWLRSKINVQHWELNPDMVTHLGTNRARHRLTLLIETNVLPLRQTAVLVVICTRGVVVHPCHMSKTAQSYFSDYLLHSLLSSSCPDLTLFVAESFQKMYLISQLPKLCVKITIFMQGHVLIADWSVANFVVIMNDNMAAFAHVCTRLGAFFHWTGFLENNVRSTIYHSNLSDQSAREISVRIRVRLRVALFQHFYGE